MRLSPGSYLWVLFESLGHRHPVYHRKVDAGLSADRGHMMVRPWCRRGTSRLGIGGVSSIPRVHADAFARPCKVCFPSDDKGENLR